MMTTQIYGQMMQETAAAVQAELHRAVVKFPRPQASAHEGYAVLLEEVDEAWEAIKRNDIPAAKKEMVQVAAMAMRFILEVQEPRPKVVPPQATLPPYGREHSHPQHPDPTIGRPR